MEFENEEHTVRLKGLLFAVLYQWRKMLVFMIAFALLLGGYKGAQSWRTMMDASAVEKYESDYQAALEEYEQSKASLELQIEDLQASVDHQQAYLENSVLMSLDCRNFYSATARFYISTGYEIMPGMTYQNTDQSGHVLVAYLSMLSDTALLSDVAKQTDIEMRYLKELVTISGLDDHILTVSVRYSDLRGAQRILDRILAHMDEINVRITDSICAHSIDEVAQSAGVDLDLALADLQQEERKRLASETEELEKLQDQLSSLVEPQKTMVSKKTVVFGAVKYGIVGAALGCVLVTLTVFASYVFGDGVYGAEELAERFRLRTLGVLTAYRKDSAIDRWLRKKEGRTLKSMPYELVGANIDNYVRGARRVLVVDAASAAGTEIAKELQKSVAAVQLICAGSLLEDVNALQQLPECDGVIFIVTCKDSRYSLVGKQLERVCDAGKRVYGCIVLET